MLSSLPLRPPVNIEFRNLNYSVNEGRRKGIKAILKNVHGSFYSGELTAIMGPSGTGKSTLMNVLAGFKCRSTRNRLVSGQVLINGHERDMRTFRRISCYIMQDNDLLCHLSVFETMMIAANLKLSEKVPLEEKRQMVHEILEALGIIECQKTKVSSLSGGERKRLCIAQELVSNPPVMFFDEPTSGLDSSSCGQCISLLKSLATGGRTIVCTIHQPSARIFEMFDKMLMLADGQCIYRGKPAGLIPFLSSMNLECPPYHNPADFVIEVACGEHGDCISKLQEAVNSGQCDLWSTSERIKGPNGSTFQETDGICNRTENLDVETGASKDPSCVLSLISETETVQFKKLDQHHFATSCWTQFRIIFIRTILSILREPMLTHFQILSQAVTGVLIGLLFFDIGNDASSTFNNAACLFFSVLFITFESMMPTILTFPLEMSILVREHLNCWYSLKAYYLARTTADVPFQLSFPIIYCTIMYWMTSQPNEWSRFILFILFAMITSLVSQSLGLLVGATFKIQVAVFLGPSVQIPLMLFCGFFAKFRIMPVYLHWLSYVSYVRYTFEGIMLSMYGNNREDLQCKEDYCYFELPEKILEEMDLTDDRLYLHFIALFIIFIILRIAGYLVLCCKIRSEQ